MLLNFKEMFADLVQTGEKTHSIRATRKIRPKVGEIVHCYTGLRQKGARLLGRFPCIKVEDVRIVVRPSRRLRISINGEWLSDDEVKELAWRDGFRAEGKEYATEEMWMFWHSVHGYDVFDGQIIHWAYKEKK